MSPQQKYSRKLAATTYHLFRPDDGEPLLGLHPKKPNTYLTLRRLHYESLPTKGIEIPKGFATDLASIPKWLRWLPGYDPTDPRLRMAIIHDACYSLQNMPREDADWLFRSGLKADGVPFVQRWLMYFAVRLFGRKAWYKHAAEKQAAEREHGEPD